MTELHRPAVAAFKRGTESDKSLEIASNGENISQLIYELIWLFYIYIYIQCNPP